MAQKIDNEVTVPLNQNIDDDELDNVQRASDIYGEWGPLQRNMTIYFVMIYIVSAFQNTGVVFYLTPINYHCQLPPGFEDRNVSKCFTFEGSTEKCSKWQFDNSFYKKTLIDEFELVCEREYYISLTKSIFQIGFLVASIFMGWLSDKYGRLFAFKVSVILEIIASLSQALSVNIVHFVVSRFFLGIGSYGRFSTGFLLCEYRMRLKMQKFQVTFLLVFELVGPNNRASINIVSELGWCMSTLFLPVAHYFIPHFRYMQLTVFGYELIFLVWLWRLPESPRWLITHDRFDEAATVIRKAAKSLKQLSDTEIETKLDKLRRYSEKEQLKSEAKKTIFDLWSHPILFRYCALLYVINFCLTFVSYSFSYNAASYGGSIHITIFVQGLSKALTSLTVYFLVNRFTRRSLLMFLGICAVCSILAMLPLVFETNVGDVNDKVIKLSQVKITSISSTSIT